MDIKELENWLWDIASILRGPIQAYNYKDYILPLIFLKKISYYHGAKKLTPLIQVAIQKNHKLKTAHRVALYYPNKP
jgi:Type I restriction-modification system methyltransferase subunit